MLLWLSTLLLVPAFHQEPTIETLDKMAVAKDAIGLGHFSFIPASQRDPFKVLQTGGAYGVGRFGWHAYELPAPNGKGDYVVIGTALTSEDVGEIVLQRRGAKLVFVPESDAWGAHIDRHRFDVHFDIPHKHVAIEDRMTLSHKAGPVLFRMSPPYQVKSIVDEGGKNVAFKQGSGVVIMDAGPQANGQTLTIRYEATVNLPQYAASISAAEATLVNDYWYPMIARGPAPYEITMHGPKDWVSVAQGEKLSETVAGDEKVTKYRMDLPVVYFSAICAPFKVAEEKIGGRTFHAWSARLNDEKLRMQCELYAGIFNYYSSIFCPPPYPLYGAVDSKTYGGGALEAYTFATWGGGFPSEDAHEPAHTWWGGIINNTYLNSFWNESFAVFTDGLYHRNVPIGNVSERRLAFVSEASAQDNYTEAAMSESGADIGGTGSSLGYGKGARVLQMLEQWLGTEKMILAMKTWSLTQPKGVPGEWEDFERVVTKQNSGKDIKGFFDDWVRRPGYASFEVTKPAWNDGKLSFDLHWKGSRFRMPLTVLLADNAGHRTYHSVFLDGKTDTVTLPSPSSPNLVSIDPWRQSLRPISEQETPVQLGGALGGLRKVVEPTHADWMKNVEGNDEDGKTTTDPAGCFLVGSPETWPLMADLCKRAGFVVKGDQLAYDGTTIDLTKGCAVAIVDLPEGKRCAIGLGKTRIRPGFGRSRLCLTDDLGRFLRGSTEPKTAGPLTFRLP